MTGAVMGLLLKAHEEGLIKLRPVVVMDNEGNYTNKMELRDLEDDRTVFFVTIDSAV
jgi:hypothetical protein